MTAAVAPEVDPTTQHTLRGWLLEDMADRAASHPGRTHSGPAATAPTRGGR